MRPARFGLWLLLSVFPASTAAADPVLERVVMVSRHGVRSPIRPIEALDMLTQRSWPKWPVGPGEMTAHGARNLGLMADFLRETYRTKGVLPADGCPPDGTVDLWSDAADRRTRQSGDIFAEHLAPGCGLRARHAPDAAPDPLFNATETNLCPIGLLARAKSLAASYWQRAIDVTPEERHALETLQQILAPEACNLDGKGLCLTPQAGASAAKTNETLAIAAVVAEGLYLEYAQGFPKDEVGWGKAGSGGTIAAVMPAYERGINFMRRNPVVSARRGTLLVQTILSLLQGAKPPAETASLTADAKLVMIAGHDSNLLQAAVLMGLDWHLPNQPSVTAPDTTLAFEVWRDTSAGSRMLRVVVYAQTLEQLRDGMVLDGAHPPDVVEVVPEACAGTGKDGCPLATFVSGVERHLATLCKG